MLGIEELIVFDVEQAAYWRRLKAKEFPDDHRNTAAEILERLAEELRALEGTELHERLAEVTQKLTEDAAFSPIVSDRTNPLDFGHSHCPAKTSLPISSAISNTKSLWPDSLVI